MEVQVYKANELSNEDVKLLVSSNIIPKDTPKDVIALFGKVCSEKQLSPFSKQIHLIPRAGKYTFQTSIDGYRSIAERTGVYAGNDDYLFNGGKSEFDLIDNKILKPTTATATVYKVVGGLRCPFSATARWEEYYPGESLGFMWKKMPFLMLGKCAEALALRKAFPEALGGIYTDEEMKQADKVQDVEVVEVKNRNYTAEANECRTLIELETWFKSLSKDEQIKYKNLTKNRKEELQPKEDVYLLFLQNLDKQDFSGTKLEAIEKKLNETFKVDVEKAGVYVSTLNKKAKELNINYKFGDM